MSDIHFVTGPDDITLEEFEEHFIPRLRVAAMCGASFVVCDNGACDRFTQSFLSACDSISYYTICHRSEFPNICICRVDGPKVVFLGPFTSAVEQENAIKSIVTNTITWERKKSHVK